MAKFEWSEDVPKHGHELANMYYVYQAELSFSNRPSEFYVGVTKHPQKRIYQHSKDTRAAPYSFFNEATNVSTSILCIADKQTAQATEKRCTKQLARVVGLDRMVNTYNCR